MPPPYLYLIENIKTKNYVIRGSRPGDTVRTGTGIEDRAVSAFCKLLVTAGSPTVVAQSPGGKDRYLGKSSPQSTPDL
ncbi:hypothetical protein Clacol_004025 [Clathrus columnatus]|uniref:Uncharacterized protein n=1 Tax=Clathrus columnatus TaxID=1419009 RepID=A0AAV5ABE8_9AGAM|nr:hypothetical protein Clacol_004025 [Clathrus columnatus]